MTTDRFAINSDSLLIRNSLEGLAWLQNILSLEPIYTRHPWGEQQVMIDSQDEFKSSLKLIPQRVMNSYNHDLYRDGHLRTDQMGYSGQWEKGDLLLHFPATQLPHRLDLVKHYSQMIVK